MKNSLNLVLIILFFIVLGCSCPKMDELSKKGNSSITSSSPSTSSDDSTDTKSNSKSLTLENYNKIKDGMSYKEVVDILGSEGVEQMSSGTGKYKVTSYKWEGDAYAFITVTFIGDKMSSRVQYGMK